MSVKVSVIIPVYNVQDFLKKCVESVISQTLTDIQIILVDDGSTDNSGKICDEYAKKDKRIIVIHKQNQGLGFARNTGLDEANGKYIFFLDSDDWVLPYSLEQLFNTAEQNNADIVCYSLNKVYDRNQTDFIQEDKQVQILTDKNDLMKKYMLSEISSTAWSKLYKHNVWENLRFTDVRIHEDAWIGHLVIDKCNTVVITNQKYYAYYQRPESLVRSNFKELNFKCIEVGKRYVEFCNEKYPALANYAYYNLIERQLYILDKMKNDKAVKQFKTEYKNIIKELKVELPYIKDIDSPNTKRFILRANTYFHPFLAFIYKTSKKILGLNK